eukprot:1357964-Prymnesium_polylepis.1
MLDEGGGPAYGAGVGLRSQPPAAPSVPACVPRLALPGSSAPSISACAPPHPAGQAAGQLNPT